MTVRRRERDVVHLEPMEAHGLITRKSYCLRAPAWLPGLPNRLGAC